MFRRTLFNAARPLVRAATAQRSLRFTPLVSKFAASRSFATVSIEEAKRMPRSYQELSNEAIVIMCSHGDQSAREERLKREIMAVDNVSYEDAVPRFLEISRANKEGMGLGTLPYKVGILMGVTAAFASIPLVFEFNTVLWFNEHFVTTDVPEDKDLETWLEVGAWAWNWMEPPLGQISFFLLCLQFTRSQMQNIDLKPYGGWLADRRANSLVQRYPQYNKFILEDFARNDSKNHSH